MVGEKFFINISSLDSKELNGFIRFSKSSFLNKKAELTKTLILFKKNKKHFKNLLKNENLLFKTLFPKEILNKKQLKNHFQYCEYLFEDFIVYHISQNNKEQRLQILSTYYAENNIVKEALSSNSKLISIVEKKKINFRNYYSLFDLNLKRFNILLNDFNYETFQFAEKAIDYLDQYYFLEKFNIHQELLADTIMSSRKYDVRLINEIENEISKNAVLSKKLLFQIYNITNNLYQRKVDKEVFQKLKELIIPNIEKFDFKSKKKYLEDIGNYLSILYSATGDNSLLKEFFENYKVQLKHETLLKNCVLPDANFAQIVRVSLFLKEYDWAVNFVAEYENSLENKDLVLISKAEIAYNQKKYEQFFEIANKVDLNSTKLKYELKALYAKVFYDTKEFESLENHLNSFEIYLRRQKTLSELVKTNNLNFVLYLKRLLSNVVKPHNLKILKKDIEADKGVFNRNWLLIRVDLLLK